VRVRILARANSQAENASSILVARSLEILLFPLVIATFLTDRQLPLVSPNFVHYAPDRAERATSFETSFAANVPREVPHEGMTDEANNGNRFMTREEFL